MTIPTIKIKVRRKAVVKGKALVRFPASVSAESPIIVDKTGGNFVFGLDVNALASSLAGIFMAASLADGSAAAPSLYFTADTNTGLYRIGNDNIGVAVGGSKVLDISSSLFAVTPPVGLSGRTTITYQPAYDLASNALGVAILVPLDSATQTLAVAKNWNGIRFTRSDGQDVVWTIGAGAVATNIYSKLTSAAGSDASSDAYGAILHVTNAGPGNVRGAHLGGFASVGSTGFISAAALQISPVSTTVGAWGAFASLTSSGANGIAVGYGIETSGDTYAVGFGSTIAPVGYTNAVYRAWMATGSAASARAFQILNNGGSEIGYWDKSANIVANSIKLQSSNILATVTGSGTSIVSDTQPTINTSLTITGGALANGTNALTLTATQPTTPVATQNAISFTVTGAGTAAINNRAFLITYAAGYTGASTCDAFVAVNSNAGTGSTVIPAAGSNTTAGNRVGVYTANGTTTGANFGSVGTATGGDTNVGAIGLAQGAKNSAKNFGVIGTAINTGTSPVHVGVLATLNGAVPAVSAALIADNGSQTDPIARFQDNGTDVLVVADGGVATLCAATATPAGGSTSARLLFGTTAGFGIYFGSGAPTVSAAQGSVYLRSDGSSTSTRFYVNTNGATTWTNVTAAA